ncbi:MAG: DNA polymerase III subunit gamma/tau [Patescibacteria group bacterium]|jgi:DNA polymerase-3 subunit gamma/tau
MTKTFYLKYRPQNFQDLDSTAVREELIKIFSSGRPSHAFLFTGPRGIGKTSAARIVAKAVNCEQPQGFEPCNQCESCLSITNGTNVDVFEIDAASNRGIDDIKELRDKIRLAPSSSKHKVYIIDEVHMLTTEAFNALLKTLEEPPEHAIFVLCTTDPEKLPKTIVSRCQRIAFSRATKKEIVERLKRICEKEGIEAEEKALEEIAKMADGGFRDANKILEQISLSGKVTLEEVGKTAGVSGESNLEDFLTLLSQKKAKEALAWINTAVEKGINLRTLTESLLQILRGSLLESFGFKDENKGFEIKLNAEEIKRLIELFSRAYFELRSAVIPQLPLEMSVIEWCEDEVKSQKVKVKSKDEGKEDQDNNSGSKGGSGAAESASGEASTEANSEAGSSQALAACVVSLETVLAKWSEILEKVRPLNHSVQAFLKASRPLACESDFLILEVFYKFHKDQLESEKCRRIFEKTASEVLGCSIKLKCSLSENPKTVAKPLPKIEEFIPEASVNQNAKTVVGISSQKSADDDIIKLAEDIFNKGTIN